MLLQAFYIKSLDEINTVSLSQGEVQVRTIAKTISIFPTFIIYALFLPLLMILYYCHVNTGIIAHNLLSQFIIKPIRWTSYQIVYWFCNLFRQKA
jgi:hypothetical protein